MIRLLPLAPVLLLTACMTLPGSDTPPASRYLLTNTSDDCSTGDEALSLSVLRVNAGLDNDRIAVLEAGSGQLSYLKDVRWADELGPMLEQQLAGDLECHGYAVMSGHRHSLGQARLTCEVRAFNLLKNGGNQAEVAVSCVLDRDNEDRTIITRHSAEVTRWSADAAVAALSTAYGDVVDDIVASLR